MNDSTANHRAPDPRGIDTTLKMNLSVARIENVISRGTTIRGAEINCDCGILISGNAIGCRITCKTGTILIHKGAQVSGRFEAPFIVVVGEVNANGGASTLIASTLLTLHNGSKVRASIVTPQMSDQGADLQVDGRMSTGGAAVRALHDMRNARSVVGTSARAERALAAT